MCWSGIITLYLLGAALAFNQALVWDELGEFKRSYWVMFSCCIVWPLFAVFCLFVYWISGGPVVRSMGERRD